MTQRPTETPLRIVFVGHVDHGKSTLVGRLFHDTGALPEGKLEQIQATCERRGVPFEWAFLMDALQAERDQNITIDTSQIWFRTDRRPYVIIDAPGHREFLKNMITGAASADAAFLLIAANEGVREQSRRHGLMLSLLGIEQVVVLVNKLDLVDYAEDTFDEIEREYREFLEEIGLDPIRFIPVSARDGDNVAERAGETMPWYVGPTVVDALDAFEMPRFDDELPLRLPIQDVYRFDDRRILSGRLEGGTVRVGDEIVFQPYDKVGIVESIERWSAPAPDTARAGDSVGIKLTEQIFVERGHVASHPVDQPRVTNRFRANLFWMGRRGLRLGETYKLKLATQEVEVRVTQFERVIDAATLEEVDRDTDLRRDDVAEVVVESKSPVAVDRHTRIMAMGRFVLVDRTDLAGGGIVTEILERTDDAADRDLRPVAEWERYSRNGHRGAVVWLGPHAKRPGFAAALGRGLYNRGLQAMVVDREIVHETPAAAAVTAALALAGTVGLTDLAFDPPAGLDAVLGKTDAEFYRVDLSGRGEAELCVDVDELGIVAAVQALIEALLPRLRQTWTVG